MDDFYDRHKTGVRSIFILAGAVLVYVIILLLVNIIGNSIDKTQAYTGEEPMGSLEGRFTSQKLTLDYAGKTWTYNSRGMTNILFIGIDWAQDERAATFTRYGSQADFIMLMSIDRKTKTIYTIPIDRDTVAPIRVYGVFGDYAGESLTQICLAQAYGDTVVQGCENTVWTVSRLFCGIPIDAYVAVDMDGITALNDALGGVEVTLNEDFSALDPAMTAGTTLTLQGKQAETFVRARMSVGDGTNVARMQRQQTFVAAASDILFDGLKKDMGYAGTLFDSLSTHMTTNLTRGEMVNLAYECRDYTRDAARVIVGAHTIGEDGFVEFHADEEALQALLTKLYFE